jgi:hypothetical protein
MRVATDHDGFLGAHNLEDAGSNPARRIANPLQSAVQAAVCSTLVAFCSSVLFP